MLTVLSRRWTVLALRGVFAVLLGIMALAWPGLTLLAVVGLFGGYALASGILSGIMAFTAQPARPRWLLALEAVVGVAVGAIAWTQMGLTALTLVYLVGAFAVVTGISRIVQAIMLREQIPNEWLLGASGALTTILGVLVMSYPAAGALAFAWILGLTAIAVGAAEIGLAMKVRALGRRAAEAGPRVWSMRAEERPEVKVKR